MSKPVTLEDVFAEVRALRSDLAERTRPVAKPKPKKRARPQHRPPRTVEPDDLTRKLANQALRRHGLA